MALLGSHKFPAFLRVHSLARAIKLMPDLHAVGANFILAVDPKGPEQVAHYAVLVHGEGPLPSGKLGPNDPCPCHSGKKYKTCCLAQVEEDETLGHRMGMSEGYPAGITLVRSVTDRRLTERSQAQMHRAIATQSFGTVDEVNAFLEHHRQAGTLASFKPETPEERSQELVYDAWEAKTPKKRVSLAQKALALDPDCADAYVLLADEQPLTLGEKLKLYRQGMEVAERGLGPEIFKHRVGQFWSDQDTRPYMRARAALAKTLWTLGGREEAIAHLREMLRLNPGDHQGVRYWLVPWLIVTGQAQATRPILRAFAPDWRVDWLYLAALVEFQAHGPSPTAHRWLAEAMIENSSVVDYLIGQRRLPAKLPDLVAPGSEDEAIACALVQKEAWETVPGAIAWLKGAL